MEIETKLRKNVLKAATTKAASTSTLLVLLESLFTVPIIDFLLAFVG
jgi:hypothetical protein